MQNPNKQTEANPAPQAQPVASPAPHRRPRRRRIRAFFTKVKNAVPFLRGKEYVERNLDFHYERHREHRHKASGRHHGHAHARLPVAAPEAQVRTKESTYEDGMLEGQEEGPENQEQEVQTPEGVAPLEAAVAAPAPTLPEQPAKPTGSVLHVEPKIVHNENAEEIREALLENAADDAFLGSVISPMRGSGAVKPEKVHGWSLLRDRFFRKFSKRDSALPGHLESDLAKVQVDIQKDAFLKNVVKPGAADYGEKRSLFGRMWPFKRREKESIEVPVRTEQPRPGTLVNPHAVAEEPVPEPKKESATAGTLEEFASGAAQKAESAAPKGRILTANDKRIEMDTAREEADKVAKDVKEARDEIRAAEEALKKKEEAAKIVTDVKNVDDTPKVRKKQSMQFGSQHGFQQFLAAIGHIGLGKERIRFIQNLATMLGAGLPLIDSLKTLQMETRAKPMKKLLQRMLDAVENGSPLWRAMEQQNFFSLQALALVRIGEEAGNLAENIAYLATQEEKDHELKSKVKMAMIYPTIVMTIMFIIVIGLGMFVLPNLIGVLYSLNVELPLVTRLIIMFTNAFTSYGAVGVPSFMVGCVAIAIIAKYTPLKVVFQWIMFRIPGIGALAREATIARFGVILGGLLKAGVPVIEALHSLVDVTPIVSYRRLYSRILDHITVGDSFSKSFAAIKGSQKLLPPSVQQLVITGEKSGALADIMLKVADIYDKKATETAQKLPVILEPLLLLFIGGLVGTIAFAIIIPIYSIVGNVGR